MSLTEAETKALLYIRDRIDGADVEKNPWNLFYSFVIDNIERDPLANMTCQAFYNALIKFFPDDYKDVAKGIGNVPIDEDSFLDEWNFDADQFRLPQDVWDFMTWWDNCGSWEFADAVASIPNITAQPVDRNGVIIWWWVNFLDEGQCLFVSPNEKEDIFEAACYKMGV